MSDWIHCNKCIKKYNPQTTFYLVECGHIFCQRCVEKIKISKKCVNCGKSGHVLPLSKDMDQNVLDFFLPPESLFRKGVEVYKYQLQQRTSLIQNLIAKYEYAKKEYVNCTNCNKDLMKQNQMLQNMLRSSGKNPQRFMTSTPCSQMSDHNNITFQNTSMLSSIAPRMGSARKDNPMTKVHPGYAKRSHIFSSGSSQGPSPAQRVPLGHGKMHEAPMIHRGPMGTMHSLEELRRSGKSQ